MRGILQRAEGSVGGTGAGSTIPLVDLEGTTANEISNTVAALGSAPKLIDFAASLPPQYRENARMVMHPNTLADIQKLVDAEGRPYFPTVFGTPPSLLTYPILLSPFMPEGGADGRMVIILGDFEAAYVIADRMLLTVRVLLERWADEEMIGLRLNSRVGGDVINPRALRIGAV